MPDKRRRILCVDDQNDICSLVSAVLPDYEIVCAQNKAEALRKATHGQFDLYLVDYFLTNGNGLEVCALIRYFDGATPILFLTVTRELSQQQLEGVDAQGVICKADLPHALLSAVQRVFAP